MDEIEFRKLKKKEMEAHATGKLNTISGKELLDLTSMQCEELDILSLSMKDPYVFKKHEIELLNEGRCPRCENMLQVRKGGLVCKTWNNFEPCKNYHSYNNGPYFYKLSDKWIKEERKKIVLSKEK